jgi:hypothetical protein
MTKEFFSGMTSLSPFFEFVLAMVIPGALVISLAALLWTCDGRALPASPIWSPPYPAHRCPV